MKRISVAFSRKLEGSGVTHTQWIALYHIYHNQKITQRALSKFMSVNDSTIGRLVDRMQRDDLLKRVKDSNDRRVFLIQLTENGKELFDKILPLGDEFSKELVKGISKEDRITFESVLSAMVENVSKENE